MNSRFYSYTLYREPDHSVLLDHVSGVVCSAWMQKHEGMMGLSGWKYLKHKILSGEVPEYQLTVHTVFPKEQNRRVFAATPKLVQDAELGTTPPMCGYCDKWTRGAGERENLLRMGTCAATGKKTERCHWCDARKGAE